MADNDLTEIEERFERLSFEVKLRLLERLIRQLRHGFIDSRAFERSVSEMAADPTMQRELSGRGQQP